MAVRCREAETTYFLLEKNIRTERKTRNVTFSLFYLVPGSMSKKSPLKRCAQKHRWRINSKVKGKPDATIWDRVNVASILILLKNWSVITRKKERQRTSCLYQKGMETPVCLSLFNYMTWKINHTPKVHSYVETVTNSWQLMFFWTLENRLQIVGNLSHTCHE